MIRNGVVVDGTGAAPRRSDVAIEGNMIVEVGNDVGRGRREIDAEGMMVTPGHVGPVVGAIVTSRRDHRGDGQLRSRLRTGRLKFSRRTD